jgi:NADH-quinone oxidoreductase subunit J
MWFSYLFLFAVGAIALAAAVGVVVSRMPVHSALFLLLHFAMIAALYITMDAQFLGAIQVIIYAGGIVILILFVIMLMGSESVQYPAGQRRWLPWVAISLGVILLVAIGASLVQAFGGAAPNPAPNAGGVPEVVGIELFTRYILPFEMVGVLLLVALIGALLLARRSKAEQVLQETMPATANEVVMLSGSTAPSRRAR